MKKALFAIAAVSILALSSSASAQICYASPSGAEEVPMRDSTGVGLGTFVLTNVDPNTGDGQLVVIASVFDLPEINASHIHNAPVGVNGPVVFGIGADYSTLPQVRTWNIPAAMVTELLNGNLYYNIHTQTYPGGEIRGQIYCL